MREHTTQAPPPVPARRRHRAPADALRLPPSLASSALTGAAVGVGWLIEETEVLPAPAGVTVAVAASACVLWWTTSRVLRARRALAREQRVRGERDEALRALEAVVEATETGLRSVRWAAEQAAHGAAHTNFAQPTPSSLSGNICLDAVSLLGQAFNEAWRTVMAAATRHHQQLNAQAELAEIFQSIVPRLQSLVNRGIAVVDEAERDIEDPDLMAQFFRVDHLLTQSRRAVESLAVLGGSTPPRDSAPVLLATAIRQAVSETPEFARVRVAPPSNGAAALPGYVSPNVVHLLAALMENATGFSTDRVEVHTHESESGTVIEVLDRGTGMSQRKRDALNRLLASPETEDPRARLREGKIGLLVAALLARRHNITIRLAPNIVGGTQAVVILPEELLVTAGQEAPGSSAPRPPRQSAPLPPVPARSQCTDPGERTGLPRRVRSAGPPPQPQLSSGQAEDRPALPRRSEADRHVPPAGPQVAAGRATGGLMANFRSRKPSDDFSDPTPSA
ncbi:ATP-binding protein [Streptomyces sp. NPDC059631]|uniref:ATP-binding protein n=1 Tax=unclassified Streptomyces TaxID=2593676 RepID=UPI0036C2396E